jgi:hypothetical protein
LWGINRGGDGGLDGCYNLGNFMRTLATPKTAEPWSLTSLREKLIKIGFVFNQLGDVERCALRSGNVHSAGGWRTVLEPVVARYREVKRLYFRGDAAFANSDIYEFLEAERIGYAIRLPANGILQDKV